MKPQGRAPVSPLSTRRRNKTHGLRKTTGSSYARSNSGAECNDNNGSALEPMGELFLLTFLFIGRSPKSVTLRGLNPDHNHDLKDIFKGAATRVSSSRGPLRDFYENLLAQGKKPTMARLTLARKIAAITLAVWKKEVDFDVDYLKSQAA